jgi:hypothetical protein
MKRKLHGTSHHLTVLASGLAPEVFLKLQDREENRSSTEFLMLSLPSLLGNIGDEAKVDMTWPCSLAREMLESSYLCPVR